jgi:hypothetical protein
MKKLFLVFAMIITLSLGACSSSGTDDPENTSGDQANKEAAKKEEPITEASLMGNMHLYYGNLHGHTKYSWGEVKDYSPAESYQFAKDLGLDFCAVTDHDVWMGLNIIDTKTWEKTGADADAATKDGDFVAIRGFEWSNTVYGHICIYDTADFTTFIITPFNPIIPELTPSIYTWIDNRNALAEFNHPGREEKMFDKFKYNEAVADNFCLVETGNKDDGNYTNDFIPNYVVALDNGWKLGPTSNQDNHVLHINSHRTVVVAPELTRASLFDSMRERRTYSTDDPNLRLIFKAGDSWMGSTVYTEDDSVVLTVMVNDDEPVTSLEIITNGGKVAAIKEYKNGEKSVLWQVAVPCKAGSYFFVKTTSADSLNDELSNLTFPDEDRSNGTQVAVSAPIWIEN